MRKFATEKANPMIAATKDHTYHHRFKDGTVASMTFSATAWNVEWSRRPHPGLMPEYIAWRRTVIEDFTRRTGQRVLIIDLVNSPRT
jgi:hypothetical protein